MKEGTYPERVIRNRQLAQGACAIFRTVSAQGVRQVRHDVAALNEPGFHVVVATFEGDVAVVTMDDVRWHPQRPWQGAEQLRTQFDEPEQDELRDWVSSLDEASYCAGVDAVRAHIAAGTVYQVNLCRVLSRRLGSTNMDAVFARILASNPAPYAARIDIAEAGLNIASASPELYLRQTTNEGRSTLASSPIKGTAPTLDLMLEKDATENVMITDLVRNDVQQVCTPGSVWVDGLLAPQEHPGLVHLVSTVVGEQRPEAGWADVFNATFPPGSVSGAPKLSALDVIGELEQGPRGPYCGAIGWVDSDRGEAELAVGIRTFWTSDPDHFDGVTSPVLHFGTGAGITWDSDPLGEWRETELKARRLLAIADAQISGR